MTRKLVLSTLVLLLGLAPSAPAATDLLVKFKGSSARRLINRQVASLMMAGGKVEHFELSGWTHVVLPDTQDGQMAAQALTLSADVEYVQPNYPIHLINNFKVTDKSLRQKLIAARGLLKSKGFFAQATDNPDIAPAPQIGSGKDPHLSSQWGVLDIGSVRAWEQSRGSEDMVVSVIDTGVDYTHEDLLPNMWRNPGETGRDANGKDKSTNGVDDDNNGYVDDVVGWDFATNDNKPYDMTVPWWQMLLGGGNPGHGTHCAGNIAARGENGIGISGVAPNVKIMALRFLTEKGSGTTAGAIQAIEYSIKMGVKVSSNSWGSEGEDPSDDGNKALRDVIQLAESKGQLFIAAAGNGHNGVGYDNDSDAKPGYPASYPYANIISVAAIDKADALGSFSNWGVKTVDIGAPGVAVFSTMVNNVYSDTVIDLSLVGMGVIKWDGTSMATPHVAGAAALYWSKHPNATAQEVKNAILASAKPISVLQNKTVSGGKLNVEALMNR